MFDALQEGDCEAAFFGWRDGRSEVTEIAATLSILVGPPTETRPALNGRSDLKTGVCRDTSWMTSNSVIVNPRSPSVAASTPVTEQAACTSHQHVDF